MIIKNFENLFGIFFLNIQNYIQDVGSPYIDGQILTIHNWLSTIDGQVLVDAGCKELIVKILMVQVLIVHYGWSTLHSSLLTFNF